MGEDGRKPVDPSARNQLVYLRNDLHAGDRRQTSTGVAAHRSRKSADKPSLRVEKSRDSKSKAVPRLDNHHEAFQGQASQGLLLRALTLLGQLDAYKTNLISTLNNGLAEIDVALSKSMNDLSDRFSSQCEIIESAANSASEDLATDTFKLTHDDGTTEHFVLGERMGSFLQLYKSSKEQLDQLWTDYEQTQKSIMELALAILDEDSVRIMYTSLDARTDAADPKIDEKEAEGERRQTQKTYDAAIEDLERLEEDVNEQVEKSLKENDKILAVSALATIWTVVANVKNRTSRNRSLPCRERYRAC